MTAHEQTMSPAHARQAQMTRALQRAYALNWEWIAYGLLLALAVLTRFLELGARVMSHDESLHTYYSWRLFEFGEFSHTPLMHGPLLFHMTAFFYYLFGDSDFTARMYPAVLGVLIVLFPILYRRWLGRVGAVIAAAGLLISPQILYHARYIRHDTPVIFFALLMLYAILQYVDGEKPRQGRWMALLAFALIGMLASKEVAFIYIAIFGTFFALYWLLRVVQDVGIARRPQANADADWHAPFFQRALGHVLILLATVALLWPLSVFARQMLLSTVWIPSPLWIAAPLMVLVYLPLGVVGPLLGRWNAAAALMRALGNGRSAFYVLMAGVILGAIMALWVTCVLDVIKPADVWQPVSVQSVDDMTHGADATKEYAERVQTDWTMAAHLATWVTLPALVLIFLVFITAVLRYPGTMPLPWRTLLLILLIALITTALLVLFERRSFVEQGSNQPFAANPNAAQVAGTGQYDNTWIWLSWAIGLVITAGVVASRLFTRWWDFLNRQPMFDVLIVIGTLILPWAAAYPLYRAGYDLENYNADTLAGRATIEAAAKVILPFVAISASLGLSWNWKRWLPAAAIFLGLFTFFFTTVFSNQYGLVTGMIGSLGYWLEQQGVRRGSQPQYYYLLTQLPVYEFLPMLGAMGAGVLGLARLWDWRRERTRAALSAAQAAEFAASAEQRDMPPEVRDVPPGAADATLVAEGQRTAELPMPEAAEAVSRGLPARLLRPYDSAEEATFRAADPEWLGAFPFLALVGYWAVLITLALTLAGEKMPWLTTHLTLPMILLTGWLGGQIVGGLHRRTLREGGWLVLLLTPVGVVALAHVLLAFWGDAPPFAGRTADLLTATGTWFGALIVVGGVAWLLWRTVRRVGAGQTGRLALISALLVLALLTARVAYLATYINADYPTEYLVYAHAGPAVKTVMAEVDRIAEITNEGYDMRIAFNDEASWPFTWYFRHYSNYGYFAGEVNSTTAGTLEGARVVVVSCNTTEKIDAIRRILGSRYYEFSYFRLWWPMQEYFNLNYQRVANVFSLDDANIAAPYYRQGMWDIWWNRDYSTYAQAMCIEAKQFRCEGEAAQAQSDEEREQLFDTCTQAVVAECRDDDRFELNNWPVSDRLYVFVDKSIAAQVWDAGVGSATVDIREPKYPEDDVYQDLQTERILGANSNLAGPRGIAVDADGLLYIADTDHNRIAVLDADGNLLRTIGEPAVAPSGAALRQPWGVDVDDEFVYVADTWNNRVVIFTKTGDFVRAWGQEGVPDTDFSAEAMWGPRDIKLGPDGNLYVADTGGKRIRVYTPEGIWLRDIGSEGAGFGHVDEPVGLAFNPVSGELYVAEAWNQRITAFDLTGAPLRTFEVNMWFDNRESFNRPYLAVSPDGSLIFVSDMDDRQRVVAYNLDGEPVIAFNQPDDLEAGVLGLRSPAGLATDAEGRLYVVDADQARVYVFPPLGVAGQVAPVPADGAANVPPPALDEGAAGAPAPEESEPLGELPSADAPPLAAGSPNADWSPVRREIAGMAAVYVPSGCFYAGALALGEPPDADGKELCVSSFWVSATEVTNAQYARCVAEGACSPPADHIYYDDPVLASAPVVGLTWEQAQAFADWVGGTLPTEAQWEYAARGPESWPYPWGTDEPSCELANYRGCGGLLPVGGVERVAGRSWVGAADMAGSVWEWTADWFAAALYADAEAGALDPAGPSSGSGRTVRGGSWNDSAPRVHVAYREARELGQGYPIVGLRVVWPPDAYEGE